MSTCVCNKQTMYALAYLFALYETQVRCLREALDAAMHAPRGVAHSYVPTALAQANELNKHIQATFQACEGSRHA